MTHTPNVSRLDRIIAELERLHNEAQEVFDAHVDFLHSRTPSVSFGVLKHRAIAVPAGNTLDYVHALKIVRKSIAG